MPDITLHIPYLRRESKGVKLENLLKIHLISSNISYPPNMYVQGDYIYVRK